MAFLLSSGKEAKMIVKIFSRAPGVVSPEDGRIKPSIL
jgi:hypothetical protein